MTALPLKELIDEQIEMSRGMNLFSEDSLNSFRFSDSILGSLDEILKANDEELADLVEHAKKKRLPSFVGSISITRSMRSFSEISKRFIFSCSMKSELGNGGKSAIRRRISPIAIFCGSDMS